MNTQPRPQPKPRAMLDDDEPVFERDLQTNVVPFPGGQEQPSVFAQSEETPEFYRQLATVTEPGSTITLRDDTNKALSLAQNGGFLEMCRPILWGSENEVMFGEMLRGLVLEWKPRNTLHLHLLANMADALWKLNRARRFRNRVFMSGAQEPGRYGMPVGTEQAMNENDETTRLLREYAKARAEYEANYH